VPFNSKSSLPTVALNKDAFPNRQHIADRTKSFSLPKQAQVFRVSFQAQYQAFVRFAVGAAQLSQPSRSIGPAFWNLSLGAGSRFENSGLQPAISPKGVYGASKPWTDVVPRT
jgi:hypothetical protein